jgi:hypothetical protein
MMQYTHRHVHITYTHVPAFFLNNVYIYIHIYTYINNKATSTQSDDCSLQSRHKATVYNHPTHPAVSVQASRLQIHQDGSGHIAPTSGFVKVDVDTFQLKVRITWLMAGWGQNYPLKMNGF